jgi:hypothetical protein
VWLMEREKPLGGNGRERSSVKGWETVRVFYDQTATMGGPDSRGDVRVIVEVQRPQFEDGGSGRPALSVVVMRGDRVLRFPCRDGSFEGVVALAKLLGEVLDPERLSSVKEEFSQLVGVNHPSRRDGAGDKGKTGHPGGPGTGLGRFSTPGKTARRRRRDGADGKDRQSRGDG